MKFLECLLCESEVNIIGSTNYEKIVKCNKCDFQQSKKEPEITIIRKRIIE